MARPGEVHTTEPAEYGAGVAFDMADSVSPNGTVPKTQAVLEA
jgi:hypothetical protein